MDEVKVSLKDLRKELMAKRKESMMPVSKLSKASVMAELGKYSSPSPSGREMTKKHIETEVVQMAKLKPSKKVEKVVDEAVKEVKSKSNPRMRKMETMSSASSVASEEKVKKPKKTSEKVDAPKPKKALSQYQELWGKARKSGMSPKEASEHAKKMMA